MHEQPLTIRGAAAGARLRVELIGDLDVRSSRTAAESITALLERHPGLPVTLEAARLQFVDSSGLTVLMRAHRQVLERGTVLVIDHPGNRLLRLLRQTGLDKVFWLTNPVPSAP